MFNVPANKKMVKKVLRAQQWAHFTSEQRMPEIFRDPKLEPERAIALIREATRRELGFLHNSTQIFAGLNLTNGMFAQMNTGEGKTATALIPLALQARDGEQAHCVTVNEYLAQRDGEQAQRILRRLGLSVGFLTEEMDIKDKRDVYTRDIVYATASEFGFNYLRDNTRYEAQRLCTHYDFVLIDEVDSVLIDQARTPLIIADKDDLSIPDHTYHTYTELIRRLQPAHYILNSKKRMVDLTDQGVTFIEQQLGVHTLFTSQRADVVSGIYRALEAEKLLIRNVDYIVDDEDEVQIVDEYTGRIMEGRRFHSGLHQALESKENVPIQPESITIAKVTLQNFFGLYKRISGMTGTIGSSAKELRDTYGAPSIVIPTHEKSRRKDKKTIVYATAQEKWDAVIDRVLDCIDIGRPVLIGTISISDSEELSRQLYAQGINHSILNAKDHALEAEIVSRAGRAGSVTVATNMAGRGTDIQLGGTRARWREDYPNEDWEAIYDDHHRTVLDAGGLLVLGTGLHDSERIDNQLRGRAGRQGDPGETQFYVSLEDALAQKSMTAWQEKHFAKQDGEVPGDLEYMEQYQTYFEQRNTSTRTEVMKYDDVFEPQRQFYYQWREELLLDPQQALDTIRGFYDSELLDSPLLDIQKETLEQLDSVFMEHTAYLEYMLEGIGLRALGSRDPVVEYRSDSYKRFSETVLQELGYIYHRAQQQSELAKPHKTVLIEQNHLADQKNLFEYNLLHLHEI